MQNVVLTNELERLLDVYLDPFARTARMGQVITADGRIYRASEGYACELHDSCGHKAVVVTGRLGMWLFYGDELSYIGDEQPASWEISSVHAHCREVLA